MRCRKAINEIGPFIDGELTAQEAEKLRGHLESCAGCAKRYSLLRGLVQEVSSLPAIVPTPGESYRLMNRVRGEMAHPQHAKPGFRRVQVVAAGLSVVVAATVIGVSLAIWGGGDTGQEVRVVDTGGESAPQSLEAGATSLINGQATMNVGLGFTNSAAAAQPSLVVSNSDYSAAELDNFRNDMGTRLEFYSAFWYPTSGTQLNTADLENAQQVLTDRLAEQASQAGKDPEELKLAISSVIEGEGNDPMLPCYAEYARLNGQDVWLVSGSGPEDYLLFSDPQRPPAMILATLGGQESLKISESLLRELAATLAPYYTGTTGLTYKWGETTTPQESRETTGQSDATTTQPDATPGAEVMPADAEKEFKAFLQDMAARGNSLDIVAALEGLNYEQILLLLQGDWAALAGEGVNLSDFLKPPKRLWAVDCSSNQIIWESK
jgi:hypothetical protein